MYSYHSGIIQLTPHTQPYTLLQQDLAHNNHSNSLLSSPSEYYLPLYSTINPFSASFPDGIPYNQPNLNLHNLTWMHPMSLTSWAPTTLHGMWRANAPYTVLGVHFIPAYAPLHPNKQVHGEAVTSGVFHVSSPLHFCQIQLTFFLQAGMETMISNDVPSTQCLPPPLTDPLPAQPTTSTVQTTQAATVTVEDPLYLFPHSPLQTVCCSLISPSMMS